MYGKGFQQYRQNSVNTMTSGELLMLLYDELVKRLTVAEMELNRKNYEPFEAAVQRSVEIVNYLDQTLDHKYPISKNLAQLYEYFTYQLGRVRIGRNAKVLQEVKNMVTELRDTFREADKKSGQ